MDGRQYSTPGVHWNGTKRVRKGMKLPDLPMRLYNKLTMPEPGLGQDYRSTIPGPAEPEGDLGELDYVSAAFKWQYNWIALAGAAAFAIVSGTMLPVIAAAGVELMYLSAVPKMSRFRRLARSWKLAEEKRRLDAHLFQMAQTLPPPVRKRYDDAMSTCNAIRANYRRLSSTSQMLFVGQMEDRLKGLAEAYLRLLQSSCMNYDYLRNTNPQTIRAQVDEIERGLAKCAPKVREINERRLEILNKRIEKFGSVSENLAVIDAQCRAIEDVLALIRDQSVTLRDPQEISDQLGSLLQDVESTQQNVREVEAIFEISPSAANSIAPGMRSRVRN
jgi:hypothetical protein